MKAIKWSYFIIPGLLVFFFACNNRAGKETRADMIVPDSTAKMISSSAAVEKNKDPQRKFIRTADLKFMVRDVVKTTYAIEDITNRLGGFVTGTSLQSIVDSKTNTPVSADSTLETTYYTVENSMTIRVPNTKLDTTLKCIAPLVNFLDSRVIKANDVGIQLLSNELAIKRATKNGQRLTNAIDSKGKKLHESAEVENEVTSRDEEADNARINNLSLMDQVNYSTISLTLYQRQAFKRELLPNVDNIKAYEPGLGFRLWESVKTGWDVFESILVFLAKLWWWYAIVLIGYFAYRKFRTK